VELVTQDFRELYQIPDLELIVELTGSDAVFQELARGCPRQVRLIDHFSASLFWELYTAEEAIIQQRTEMRERVQAEREWIQQVFNSIPDEIVVVDEDLVVLDANASFLRANNLTIDEARGRRCYELEQSIRGECQVALHSCPFFEVMQTRAPASLVRKHFDREGNPRYAAIVAAPLLASDGRVAGMLESTRDITRRIRLEEELKATEVRLHQFMELAPMAAYVKNLGGQYLDINPAACRLLQRERSEILGRTDLEILPREAAEVLRASDAEVLRTRGPVSVDEVLVLGGSTFYLSTVKYPAFDGQGNLTAICGISNDVTALKEAELELTRTRDYLQRVMDNSPVIMMTTDLEGRVVSFNPGAEESLGYRREEVIGQPARIFYKDPEERDRLLRRVRHKGTVRDYETNLVRKDGSLVPVSLTLARLKDSDGNFMGTVGISEDISQRKALVNQVMQSERLAAVGRLAAGVAHEINNPLAVIGEIAGYLQDLLSVDPEIKSPELVAEIKESLPRITQQVMRCRKVTFRLLTFSRKSAARVELADVNAALEEILPFLEKEAQLAQVAIHRDYDRALPRVKIEEMQLQEIFINLISNSLQAIGKRGHGNIWIRTEQRDGKVVTSIRDDGPGIAEEVRDRLFDPFVTTKPPGQGTGLGLSICYGIIKRYGGDIGFESEPGRGTNFWVVLPIER
jgi:two-component system NtrC family sensor kinase